MSQLFERTGISSFSNLHELRYVLTDAQYKYLIKITEYFIRNNEWPPVIDLTRSENKKKVLGALQELGGKVVQTFHDGRITRFRLTLLGILLSESDLSLGGQNFEGILIKYIEEARAKLLSESRDYTLSSQELVKQVIGADTMLPILGRLVLMAPFLFVSGGQSTDGTWNVQIPESFADIEPGKERAYLETNLLKDFDPELPIDESEQLSFSANQLRMVPKKRSEFQFISDPMLREELDRDWKEAQILRSSIAQKSSVVICGGILEGLLLDMIQQEMSGNPKKYPHPPKDLNQKSLGELLSLAETIKLFDSGTLNLSRAVKDFRNLVHPGRVIRERLTVTEEDAEIAFQTIKKILNFRNKLQEQ